MGVLDKSLGIGAESTFNTYIAPDHFTEFNSENLLYVKNTVQSQGLRGGGALPRSQRRLVATKGAAGDVMFDLPSRGLGLWLAHMFGTFPAKVLTSFTFTLGDLLNHSLTVQVGVPKFDGTIDPKTVSGAKVTDWEIAVPAGGIATAKATIDGASFTRSTALAAPSYALAGTVFTFAGAALTIGGSAVANILDWSLVGSSTLKTDRYTIGSGGTKKEQIHTGFRSLTGTLNAEFTDTTAYDAVINDTDVAMVLTLTAGAESLQFTIPAARYDGDVPAVAGPEAVVYPLKYTVLDNGAAAPITVVYTTADTAL